MFSVAWRSFAIVRLVGAVVRNRYANFAVALVGVILVGTACDSLPTEESINNELYGNFQTAVASERNYDVYWLGRSFDAGGLTYEGPTTNAPSGSDRIGAGINPPTADRIETTYMTEDGCGCSSLVVRLISRSYWDGTTGATSPSGYRKAAVEVGGHPAELWTSVGPPSTLLAQTVVIYYSDTVVEAETYAMIPTTPGPDLNPLMDGQVLLAAMQNLRPYPQ
jgi:hypothetical protein